MHSVLRDSYERDWECCRCVRYGLKADLAFELIFFLRICGLRIRSLINTLDLITRPSAVFHKFSISPVVPTVGDLSLKVCSGREIFKKIEVFREKSRDQDLADG